MRTHREFIPGPAPESKTPPQTLQAWPPQARPSSEVCPDPASWRLAQERENALCDLSGLIDFREVSCVCNA